MGFLFRFYNILVLEVVILVNSGVGFLLCSCLDCFLFGFSFVTLLPFVFHLSFIIMCLPGVSLTGILSLLCIQLGLLLISCFTLID